jgi:hypothetical protein
MIRTLTLLWLALLAPLALLNAQENAATVTVGEPLNLVAETDGTNPTLQWLRNGTPVETPHPHTLLSIGYVTAADAGTYRVTSTNDLGSVTSQDYVVTVVPQPAPSGAPVFTSQPVSQRVGMGRAATFTAAASGSTPPTFQWYRNGALIQGATNATLSIPSVVSNDAGQYVVAATNAAGSTKSAPAMLDITYVPPVPTAPAITDQPDSIAVVIGSPASFTVAATGYPATTFQWFKDGAERVGATAFTLSLPTTVDSDAGTYAVRVSNSEGSVISNGAVLTLNPPPPPPPDAAPVFATQPTSMNAAPGSTVTFTSLANGQPPPTYQWSRNGTAFGYWTSPNLTLEWVTSNDNGNYSVVATNTLGSATSQTATLTVSDNPPPPPPPPPTTIAPFITVQPADVAVNEGNPALFSVTAGGTPAPTFQWSKDGVAKAGATGASLTFATTLAEDAGLYSVLLANSAGTLKSADARLTVNVTPPPPPPPVAVAPVITAHPEGLTVARGSPAQFTVTYTGTPDPTVQWMKNGLTLDGATNATLSFTAVQDVDSAVYLAKVMNSAGTVRSNEASLSVFVPPPPPPPDTAPAITTQPKSLVQHPKTIATFTVVATGVPAPAYQWYKNGSPIDGATGSSLVLRNINRGSRGTYQVRVSNALGSVVSVPATLTVN